MQPQFVLLIKQKKGICLFFDCCLSGNFVNPEDLDLFINVFKNPKDTDVYCGTFCKIPSKDTINKIKFLIFQACVNSLCFQQIHRLNKFIFKQNARNHL